MSNFIDRIKYRQTLARIERLELHESFITPFFVGETNYPIKMKEHEEKLDAELARLAELSLRLGIESEEN